MQKKQEAVIDACSTASQNCLSIIVHLAMLTHKARPSQAVIALYTYTCAAMMQPKHNRSQTVGQVLRPLVPAAHHRAYTRRPTVQHQTADHLLQCSITTAEVKSEQRALLKAWQSASVKAV
jgi:hypothetical protein